MDPRRHDEEGERQHARARRGSSSRSGRRATRTLTTTKTRRVRADADDHGRERADLERRAGSPGVIMSQTQSLFAAMPLPPNVTSAHGFQALTDRYG